MGISLPHRDLSYLPEGTDPFDAYVDRAAHLRAASGLSRRA